MFLQGRHQAYPYEQSFEFYGKNDMDPCRNFTFVSEEPLDLEALRPTQNSTSERPEERGYATFINASTVILTREDISAYTVTFNVVDEQGQPVADATLTFDGKVLAPGEYVLANVPDGTYSYSVEPKSVIRLWGDCPLLSASCSSLRLDAARCTFGQTGIVLHDTSVQSPQRLMAGWVKTSFSPDRPARIARRLAIGR